MGNMFTNSKVCKLTQLSMVIQMISKRKLGYTRTRSQLQIKLRTLDRKMKVQIKGTQTHQFQDPEGQNAVLREVSI